MQFSSLIRALSINLNASGSSREILRAVPNRFMVAETILSELEAGKQQGYQDADYLKELINDGFVEVITMSDVGIRHFEELVIGPATDTLDDGEAATIAIAIEQQGIALIDERKAHRICSERYPDLRIGCTVDIFAHPEVLQGARRTEARIVRAQRTNERAHECSTSSRRLGGEASWARQSGALPQSPQVSSTTRRNC